MALDLSKTALWYAEALGWAVVPLHNPIQDGSCSCGRATCSSIGKHPRTAHGVHDATTDKGTIRDWWREWPDANVGIATGRASGVVVVDIDPRNGGDREYKAIIKEAGRPDVNLAAVTGGGGRHLFFDYQEHPIRYKLGKGIEVKSDGGYVVIAPSLHASGRRYRWRNGDRPSRGLVLSELPEWALDSAVGGKSKDGKAVIDPKRVLREGERDNELIRIAGQQRRLGYGETEIYALLSAHNRMYCEPPLPDGDIHRLARSAMRWSPEVNNTDEISELFFSDMNNARLFQDTFEATVQYAPSIGWLSELSGVWQITGATEDAHHKAMDISKQVLQIASAYSDDDALYKRLRKWAEYSASERGIRAMLGLAKNLPGIHTHVTKFDADPFLFNVQNGTIDLRTGKLSPHDRANYLTKIAPVAYDLEAQCPIFMRFLDETFRSDRQLIRYIQTLFGYAMTGSVSEQIFPIFWGTGGNGKTVLLEDAIGSVFGRDYMVRITADVLMQQRFRSHPTELMDLRGARLAVAAESGAGRLDEERIKTLTGGDLIKARRMHRDFEEFAPTHKLILMTNHKPRASNSDAIWRRLRLVPFTNKVDDASRDPELGEKLRAEAPGILNWMVRGALRWQREGLKTPEVVTITTQTHREDMDMLGLFVKEATLVDPAVRCKTEELYSAYTFWASANGIRAFGKISFNREVETRFGLTKKVSHGVTRFYGIKPLLTITRRYT